MPYAPRRALVERATALGIEVKSRDTVASLEIKIADFIAAKAAENVSTVETIGTPNEPTHVVPNRAERRAEKRNKRLRNDGKKRGEKR